jgi:hypothetical protein
MSSPEECEVLPAILIPESLEILWLHYEEAALLWDTCYCPEEGARYLHDIIMLQDVFKVLADRPLLAAVINLLCSHQAREVWKLISLTFRMTNVISQESIGTKLTCSQFWLVSPWWLA